MRAAALTFLAVAMAVSSSQAAQEAQLLPLNQLGSASPTPPSLTLPAPAHASQQDCSLAGLTEAAPAELDSGSGDGVRAVHTQAGLNRTSLAGPLCLQSDFAAGLYAQGVWDFGVEQLLLQGSFWEQVPSLLQVWPLVPSTAFPLLQPQDCHPCMERSYCVMCLNL